MKCATFTLQGITLGLCERPICQTRSLIPTIHPPVRNMAAGSYSVRNRSLFLHNTKTEREPWACASTEEVNEEKSIPAAVRKLLTLDFHMASWSLGMLWKRSVEDELAQAH